MSATVLAVLYAVHLLAAVVWIGGLVMLALIVPPGVRRAASSERAGDEPAGNVVDMHRGRQDLVVATLAELERRFTPLANLSLVILIVTGMFQMSVDENYTGFLTLGNTWAWAILLKHLAVLGMVLIAGYLSLVLEPERRRLEMLALARRLDEVAQKQLARRRARLAGLNLGFGLLTLVFTAIATAQ